MAQSMTPSKVTPMTSGQIGKVCDLMASGLRKAGLLNEPVQQVIETGGSALIDDLIVVVRKYVEVNSNPIVRRVRVNRGLSGQQTLDATGRKQYTDRKVVDAMPKGEGAEAEIVFFKPSPDAYDENDWISDDNLEKQFELWGLVPVDPYSLSKANTDDPAFADSRPNATHWKDENGKWCYAAFNKWDDGKRYMFVNRSDDGWGDDWWFAGIRKPVQTGA